MSLLVVVLSSAVVLLLAYWLYGGLLARLLRLNPDVATPAVALRDDVDFVPHDRTSLLSQHFSAIAAAGPIVGPVMAGVLFGWLPALIWILVGSIFIGGVHDLTALVASLRHKARSIAEIVREHMSPRAYTVFLCFIWLSLVYVIVAFADVTAGAFVGVQTLDNDAHVTGAGIASSSLMYLLLGVILGVFLRRGWLGLSWGTVIFLPLVGLAIWGGQHIPLDVGGWLHLNELNTRRVWNVLLMAYCFAAAVIPMWLLLQPRGHLGGYFLFAALGAGFIGVLLGGNKVQYPAFLGWTEKSGGNPLFPYLFVTIACGACSGFHALVASGTSSKQVKREPDARLIGYGAMLFEAMVAIISLACVMMLAKNDPLVQKSPNFLYAQGIGRFLTLLRVPIVAGVTFGLMAFTTFVYDTLDVCTRLGRYVFEELFGLRTTLGRYLATGLTAGVPLVFLLQPPAVVNGVEVPIWKTYWGVFGASNQLLAALTLIGVTTWLWQTRRAVWVWFVAGLPAVWMYAISVAELARIGYLNLFGRGPRVVVLPWVAGVLVTLAVLMLIEAIRAVRGTGAAPPTLEAEPVAVPSGG